MLSLLMVLSLFAGCSQNPGDTAVDNNTTPNVQDGNPAPSDPTPSDPLLLIRLLPILHRLSIRSLLAQHLSLSSLPVMSMPTI